MILEFGLLGDRSVGRAGQPCQTTKLHATCGYAEKSVVASTEFDNFKLWTLPVSLVPSNTQSFSVATRPIVDVPRPGLNFCDVLSFATCTAPTGELRCWQAERLVDFDLQEAHETYSRNDSE